MIEIVNKSRYKTYVTGMTLILVIGLGALYLWKREGFFVYLGVLLLFETGFLMRKFVIAIKFDGENITITSYRWGYKKIETFLAKDITIRTEEHISNIGSRYKIITMRANGRKICRIDSTAGFDEKDMAILMAAGNVA